jgi:hypothetical protein
MNRRSFLRLAGVAAAGFALDPERLLWVPGRKTFFLPPSKPIIPNPILLDGWTAAMAPMLKKGDVITIEGLGETWIVNEVVNNSEVHVGPFRFQPQGMLRL